MTERKKVVRMTEEGNGNVTDWMAERTEQEAVSRVKEPTDGNSEQKDF